MSKREGRGPAGVRPAPDWLIRAIDLEEGSSDLLPLLHLQMAAYLQEAETIGRADAPPLLQSPATIRSAGEQFFGLFEGGGSRPFEQAALIGAIALADHESSGGPLAIRRLMVRPDRQRRGAGTALLRFAVEELAQGRTVTVCVVTANGPALGLYARLGFRPARQFPLGQSLTLAELVHPGA